MSDALMKIRTLKFWTEHPLKPDGEKRQVDMVKYTYVGQGNFSQQVAPVSRLSKVLPLAGNEDNMAVVMANERWRQIEPTYRAWKEGQELPEHGTPLGAWPGITQEQAEILRTNGFRSVEDFAEANGAAMARINLPNRSQLHQMAKAYLASQDTVKAAADMKAKDDKIAALEEQMAEMMAMMKEQKTQKPARKTKAA